jgi:hypothetical protein
MTDPSASEAYIITASEIFWGGILVGITLAIHGFGMLAVLRFTGFLKERLRDTNSFWPSMATIILGSWAITSVHLVEVIMWAGFFQWKQCFDNFSTTAYFTLMEYTTLTSEYNLPQRWRLLGGIIGTAGLLTFAWSTAILITLAQEFQEQQLQRIRERKSAQLGKKPNRVNHGE